MPLMRETEIRAGAFDLDLVGFVHQLLEGVHRGDERLVVEQADVEVEFFERLGAHAGLLGHGRRWPAQDAPLGLLHAVVEHRAHVFHRQAHAVRRHVGVFGDVGAAADGDVGVHVLHLGEQVLGEDFVLGVFRTLHHFAGDTALVDPDEWQPAFGPDLADERDPDGVGNVLEVDEDFFAFFQGDGVADNLAGESVDA